MRRVVVLGRGGAGKSTFAARLGMATGIPVVELDALFWRPDRAADRFLRAL
jgi:adenylate kinase family enzyme